MSTKAILIGVAAVVLVVTGFITTGQSAGEMLWWQAIVLGIVEGLTEYLPVSSTGHLLVTQELLGIGTGSPEAEEAANAYAICIQGGAIVAVLGLYMERVKQAARGWLGAVGFGAKDPEGFQLGLNLLVAFTPAVVVGLLFNDWIEETLFGVWTIVSAWFVGGVAILGVAHWKNRKSGDEQSGLGLESMTCRMALVVGLIQCIAMWPGVSRSLVTIVGGVVVGLGLGAAVEFSFLLGVITLLAATVYKLNEAGPVMLEAYGWGPMLIGSVAAWASALIAVKWMVAYLKKHGMELFGYYRVAIALIVAGLVLVGVIEAD